MKNTLLAIALTYCGWILFAALYYLRTNSLNGFIKRNKIIASSLVMIIMSILLVNIPETKDFLKAVSGLDVDIENSKVGFISLGAAMAGLVSSVKSQKTV